MNNPSSFSSISFDAETAIKFKKLAKKMNKTHTEMLNQCMINCVSLPRDWQNDL